ncbi:hypothetical protein DRQ23_05935 [bacterium]|nr:MAG: hypothetical protein DRQ23_05935 [bacterium]
MIFLLAALTIDSEYSFFTFPQSNIRTYVNNARFLVVEKDIRSMIYIGSYNGLKGVKKFYFSVDSTEFAGRVTFGDIGSVRGLGLFNITMPLSPSITIGRERDRVYHFIPTYSENRFYLYMEGKTPYIPISILFRMDTTIYSPSRNNLILSTWNKFVRGNLIYQYKFGLGYYGTPGFKAQYSLEYKREKFIFFLRGRYISNRYVDGSNRFFERGRIDIYANTGYRFPFGLGMRYGLTISGETYGSPLTKKFYTSMSYTYRRSLNVSTYGLIASGSFDSFWWERGGEATYLRNKWGIGIRYLSYYRGIRGESFDITGKFFPFTGSFLYFTLGRRSYLSSGLVMFGGANLPLRPDLRMNINFISNNGLNVGTRLTYKPYQWLMLLFRVHGDFPYRGLSGGFNINTRMDMEKMGFCFVYGSVYSDDNGNGVFEEGEPVIRDVQIVLDGEKKVAVGRDGIYRIGFVKPGKHILSISFGNLPAYMGTKKKRIVFEIKNFNIKRIDIPIVGLGRVSGKVFHDRNRNGILDEGEEGIPNVVIMLSGTDLFTMSDRDGNYRIENIPPGMFRIRLKNLPPDFDLSIKNLILYAALRPRAHQIIDIGLAKKERPIRIKKF